MVIIMLLQDILFLMCCIYVLSLSVVSTDAQLVSWSRFVAIERESIRTWTSQEPVSNVM